MPGSQTKENRHMKPKKSESLQRKQLLKRLNLLLSRRQRDLMPSRQKKLLSRKLLALRQIE